MNINWFTTESSFGYGSTKVFDNSNEVVFKGYKMNNVIKTLLRTNIINKLKHNFKKKTRSI